jgi:hypothetical protein
MAVSVKQLHANRENAQYSTGPTSKAGKRTVSGNATRHGVLSTRLVTEGEVEEEFHELFDELCRSLRPEGILELTLVEKIAINLWRQRRLVRAEHAAIEIRKKDAAIVDQISDELGIGVLSTKRITTEDLYGKNFADPDWCKGILQEYEDWVPEMHQDWKQLKEHIPLIYELIVDEARLDKLSIDQFLSQYEEGLTGYVSAIVQYCHEQLRKSKQYPVICTLTKLIRSERSIPVIEIRDTLARYQTTLDNELYKALKALKEAQQWRLETIEQPEQSEVVVSAVV